MLRCSAPLITILQCFPQRLMRLCRSLVLETEHQDINFEVVHRGVIPNEVKPAGRSKAQAGNLL
jgi:hypothetical protein